jgi:integrase
MPKFKLTKTAIAKLAPAERDLIVWDELVKGLGLKVTPTGKKTFFLYYRTLDHTQRKPRIGDFPEIGPEQARDIAKDWLAAVRAGKDPSSERKAKRKARGSGTVSDYFEDYKTAKSELRSIGEITRIFERDILPTIGKERAEHVTRGQVSRLLDSLGKRSRSTASNARKRLSAFYAWTLPRLPDGAGNPVLGAVRPSAPPARERVLGDSELRSLWRVLENEADPWRTGLRLLILTGQRRGEVFEADWKEFDLTSRVWSIPAARTKNGKTHLVPLSPAALKLLGPVVGKGKVFPGAATGQRAYSRAARRVRTALEKELNEAVAPWSWHDIRRTVATGMQRLGVRLEVTEAVLNHISGSRAGIVGVYQRYNWADEKRAALDAWAGHVERVIADNGAAVADNVTALRG